MTAHVVAVTGASGFIGRHLVQRLIERSDVTVRALLHQTPPPQTSTSGRISWVRGDMADETSLRAFLEPGCSLVHLAYPAGWPAEQHLAATTRLARISSDVGVRRIVHCSSAVVVGRVRENRIVESTVPHPDAGYEATKLAIEQVWIDACRDCVELAILRPTAVYGAGGKNLLKLVRDLTDGNRLANWLRSSLYGRRRMNLVNVANVTAAIELLLASSTSQRGDVYIVSDDDDPANNFQDVERLLMQGLGVPRYPVRPLPVPGFVLSAMLRLMGRSNADPERVYDGSLLTRTGLSKPCHLESGVRAFAAWYARERAQRRMET